MKAIKIFILTIIALVLAISVTIGILLFAINPNNYKKEIAAFISKNAGWELYFENDIKLSFFPDLAFETKGIYFENPQEFEGGKMFSAHEIYAKLSILPILTGDVEIEKIVIKGAELKLVTSIDGRTNWKPAHSHMDENGKWTRMDAQPLYEQTHVKKISSEIKNNSINWRINLISISDLTISYTDLSTLADRIGPDAKPNISQNPDYKLEIDEFTAKNIPVGKEEKGNLLLKANFKDYLNDINCGINMQGNILHDADSGVFKLNAENIELKTTSNNQQQGQNFTVNLGFLVNIPKLFADFHMSVKADALNFTFQSNFNWKNTQKMTAEGLNMPLMQGNANFMINPQKLFHGFGIKIEPVKKEALTNFSGSWTFKGSDNIITVNDIKIKFDETNITASKKIIFLPKENGRAGRMESSVKAHIDNINMDDYMPSSKNSQEQQKVPENTSRTLTGGASELGGVAHVPTYGAVIVYEAQTEEEKETEKVHRFSSLLQNFGTKIELTMDSLTLKKIPVKNLKIDLRTDKENIFIDDISFATLDGKFLMKGHTNITREIAKTEFSTTLTGLQLAPLLSALRQQDKTGQYINLHGELNGQSKLNFNGLSVDSLKTTIAGKGAFFIKSGELAMRDIPESLFDIDLPAGGIYPFEDASASFTGEDGIFRTKDFILNSPNLKIRGKGEFNLPKDHLEYYLTLEIPKTSSGISVIPLRISGPTENISYELQKE